jgi:hypothetical protein
MINQSGCRAVSFFCCRRSSWERLSNCEHTKRVSVLAVFDTLICWWRWKYLLPARPRTSLRWRTDDIATAEWQFFRILVPVQRSRSQPKKRWWKHYLWLRSLGGETSYSSLNREWLFIVVSVSFSQSFLHKRKQNVYFKNTSTLTSDATYFMCCLWRQIVFQTKTNVELRTSWLFIAMSVRYEYSLFHLSSFITLSSHPVTKN